LLKIYGSMLCKDCVRCCEDLTKAGVDFCFFDFSKELGNLKTFLAYRDREPIFEAVKESGIIGIPCIVDESGNIVLDWSKYVGQAGA